MKDKKGVFAKMLKNLLIKTKLRINTFIVTLGFLVVLGMSYHYTNQLNSDYLKSKHTAQQVDYLKSILIGGEIINSQIKGYAIDPISLEPIEQTQFGIEKVKQFSTKQKELQNSLFIPYIDETESLIKFAKQNNFITPQQVQSLEQKWKPLYHNVITKTKKLKKEKVVLAKKFKESLESFFYSVVSVILICLAIVILLSYIISKGVLQSLNIFREAMKSLSQGSGVSKITLQNQDETAQISEYFNLYIDNITKGLEKDKQVIVEVQEVIEKVNSGLYNTKVLSKANSKEINELVESLNHMINTGSANLTILSQTLIAYGNSQFDHKIPQMKGLTGLISSLLMGVQATGNTISEILALIEQSNKKLIHSSQTLTDSSINLSQSSNSQAASLEQTAAAIEEVTTTIAHTVENTIKMDQYAKELEKSASAGKELANQTTHSMDEINEQVNAIHEAITVIDQIAFQTNILSLNAAVEAATAGEAGKGFAVVAGEVRNLASRSADAANEIKKLIESATQKTDQGKQVSTTMIQGYSELMDKISLTTELINDVTNGSKEQQEAMIQINDAITSLDQNTQKNADEATQISEMAKANQQLAKTLQIAIERTSFDRDVGKRVCDVNKMFDISKLKLNHITFKDEAFQKAQIGNQFKVKDHHECALGKWIDQHEDESFAKTQEWEELKKVHERVHKEVQNVVDITAKGTTNETLFQTATEAEKNIKNVFHSLDKIREVNCQ